MKKSVNRFGLALISLAIVSELLVGCSSAKYSSYSYTVTQGFALNSIEKDSESFIPISDNTCFVDGLRFITSFDGICSILQIKNESGNSVKVLWDDGALIDQDNVAHRIIHAGIKITDKEKAQVPSVIPDDSSIEDTIYASDYLKWNAAKGDWDYLPIVWDRTFTNQEAAASYIENMAPVNMITFKERGSMMKANKYTSLSTGSIIVIGLAGCLLSGLAWGVLGNEDTL